jgi:hypothetical protein
VVSIDRLREELARGHGRGWRLISGHILETAGSLPDLPPEVALARVEVEETAPWSRPILTRIELGHDLWIGDGTARARVHVGEGGYVHPDVELHLDAPVASADEESDGEVLRRTYVRIVKTGDPVYVWGRPHLGYEVAGYRDSAPVVVFTPEPGLHLYDAAAYHQAAAWRALPWYRKLSVLVRNR